MKLGGRGWGSGYPTPWPHRAHVAPLLEKQRLRVHLMKTFPVFVAGPKDDE